MIRLEVLIRWEVRGPLGLLREATRRFTRSRYTGGFQAADRQGRDQDLEIALDLAFQCSPDHPYVKHHPEWFVQRPDGTIQYAENPPKKYQDIYPLNFENDQWTPLWRELKERGGSLDRARSEDFSGR